MDVPLAINDIGIRNGLEGNRKSSTFSHKADVVGLSVYFNFFKEIMVTCGSRRT